jgi:hypothetical protein
MALIERSLADEIAAVVFQNRGENANAGAHYGSIVPAVVDREGRGRNFSRPHP